MVRMTAAAVFAYLATVWFGLPSGYWAVITCLIVVQGSLGATLSAVIARAQGTVIGALSGGAAAWLHTRFGPPTVCVLGLLVLPMALLAATNVKYRLAPVTAALVMLAVHDGDGSFVVALHRIAEIFLGGLIGALTALLVLPDRGATGVRNHAAAALAVLGEMVRHHLLGGGNIDALNVRLQTHIAGAEAAEAEAAQERQFHLSGGSGFGPLVRTLRRLRTDVAMIGRTVSEQPGSDAEHTQLADAVSTWFEAASKALAEERDAPDLHAVDHVGSALSSGTTLQLAYSVLRRDLDDLANQLEEQARLPGSGRFQRFVPWRR